MQEYTVTLDGGIAGIVTQPDDGHVLPAVLMLHGFASQKNEVGGMFQELAARLADRGIGSLRIDFRGWGESAGAMTDSTVIGQVADAAVAYDYLATLDFVDPQRIGVIGFSLGGSIAVFSAGEHPEWYRSMVLWSAGHDLKSSFALALGQQHFDTAVRDGHVTINLGWREVTLGRGFFDSLGAYDHTAQFAQYHGAFMVIAGTDDHSINSLNWYLEHAQGDLRAAYRVQGADHIFNVLTPDQTLVNEVIRKTSAWFEMTL